MKNTAIFVGLLLILGLCIVLTLLFWQRNWFRITFVYCSINELPCPDNLQQDLERQLRGKLPFFLSLNEIGNENYQVYTIQKELPASITINLVPATKAAKQASSEEEILAFISDQFEKNTITYEKASVYFDQQVIIIQLSTELRAVLRLAHFQKDTEKLLLILSYLDIPSIDTQIREVDVRYRLPVLRTKLSDIP